MYVRNGIDEDRIFSSWVNEWMYGYLQKNVFMFEWRIPVARKHW